MAKGPVIYRPLNRLPQTDGKGYVCDRAFAYSIMIKLEAITPGLQIDGIVPAQTVTIVTAEMVGEDTAHVVYRLQDGQHDAQLLYRDNEPDLKIVQTNGKRQFTGDGDLFRLVSEAYRIQLAHLFDPLLAVHTSLIEPLPHQITAVYDEMLPRHPLRFLLADDPGAGKTIMAGLLIKELYARGDVRRCLVCAPGSLAAQWQDELWYKFQLKFEILTRDMVEASRTGNPFQEHDLLIVRLDQVSRNEDLQARLQMTDWDLVIADEAHKMSASYFGGERKETKRYKLGRLLSKITRHFLLMTATPHNGKEEDFQLFMALLDPDRFEGQYREGVTETDTSDLMRRMVKESLVKFDGRPLFPERVAYTVDYSLSPEEKELYDAVTAYVREEFNRVNKLENGGRRGTVGFALTILQRRVASSPEAIYRSIERRRERLEKRIQAERRQRRQAELLDPGSVLDFDDEDWETLDEIDEEELRELEEQVFDSATAARTIAELEAEVETLKDLERMARQVYLGGDDRKWKELSTLIQDSTHMISSGGQRRKLVIFTEHRDTLNYLARRIRTLLGREDTLVTIHGGLRREQRRQVQDDFLYDPNVAILLATDAAGEGINLQQAHLMVNYDLPWNPNRLEQRFGRIHRIGQTEVCHLWNLVAGETREGQVYQRLLLKLQNERGALNGQVFDVLGHLFKDKPLRTLLMEAVLYGDSPEVRAKLDEAIDGAVDQDRVRELIEQHSLATQNLNTANILRIRDEMARATARRLQPYYIKSFFMAAFERLGGTVHEREHGRYQINHVPAKIRDYANQTLNTPETVTKRYERVCFDRDQVEVHGKPRAAFLCPGHPLLDAVIDLTLRQSQRVLRQGTVLVDETDPGETPRVLFYLEQAVQDGLSAQHRLPPISKQVHFVEADVDGSLRNAGYAPYLNYRPIKPDELERLGEVLGAEWLQGERLETLVSRYAAGELVPRHMAQLRAQRDPLIAKTEQAVHERLTREITYWDRRARELLEQERAGKRSDRLNSERARARAAELEERLQARMADLALEKQLMPRPPVIVGSALIVPAGLLLDDIERDLIDRRVTEKAAMQAVMEAEIALGNEPRDVSAHESYDIESRERDGTLRFIEVKGRRAGADTVALTRDEILYSLNNPTQYILALVEVGQGGGVRAVRYVRDFERADPPLSVTSVSYNLHHLLTKGKAPH